MEFLLGKAEDTISSALKLVPEGTEFVALLDPPRVGARKSFSFVLLSSAVIPLFSDPSVIQEIKKCSALKKVILVACSERGLIANSSQ